METRELLVAFNKKIQDIYQSESLVALRGENDNYKLNGRELLTWTSDVVRPNQVAYSLGSKYYQIQDDLLMCSDEIMYFTAQLFLYLPYINNPLNDSFNFQGSPVFPNYQNFEARRYSMFADVASQKVYNYWDRIGDLLATFFPKQMNQKRIYFGTAIDKIPTQFQNSSNYIWLKDFKKNQYAQLNLIRNQVVHYTTTDTEYRHQHLEIIYDKPAIISLQQNREGLADYYKEHLKLGNEGYEKTLLLLLEEINQVLYTQTTNPNP